LTKWCRAGLKGKIVHAYSTRTKVMPISAIRVDMARARVPIVLAIMVLPLIAQAETGAIPACASINVPSLPEQVLCQRRFASALPDALYATADAQIKAGDLTLADVALGCAARQMVGKNDPLRQYEWVRRRGVLAYREERVADALGHFECALRMAQQRNDRTAIAKQLKNVGSALRRLGDFSGALRTLTLSLEMQRVDGDHATGAVLNNIADVYRDLNDQEQALKYYRDAADALRVQGNIAEAAHVLGTMALMALDRGDTTAAESLLQDAMSAYRKLGDRAYQLRLHAQLVRAAIASGDITSADERVKAGLMFAAEHRLPIPPELQLQAARVDRLRGRSELAIERLREAVSAMNKTDVDRVALLDELGSAFEDVGDKSAAIRALRDARDAERMVSNAREDRQLAWLRTRFEVVERERMIAVLERDNQARGAILRQRTLMLWLTALSSLAALLMLSILFLRRQHRARLTEAQRRVVYEQELLRYRRETEALIEDRGLLQALLDSREDAECLMDAEGVVLAVNRAACDLLGIDRAALAGSALAECIHEQDARSFAAALECMEDTEAQSIDFVRRDGEVSLSARLAQWDRGDGLVVIKLRVQSGANIAAMPVEPSNQSAAQSPALSHSASSVTMRETVTDAASLHDLTERDLTNHDTTNHDTTKTEFRRALASLMLAVVDAWERSSGLNRLELAERSRIWRVTVDDGRLRARAMERYLVLSKMPLNPRWRDVVRSAYFVLAQCTLDPPVREDLQRKIDVVFAYTRRSALV
jgi:two-component system, sensor histidine kinase ChiS